MAAVYLLLACCCLLQWSSGNAFQLAVSNAQVLPSSQCGQSNPLQNDEKLMETGREGGRKGGTDEEGREGQREEGREGGTNRKSHHTRKGSTAGMGEVENSD